jgi:hypothetical protein
MGGVLSSAQKDNSGMNASQMTQSAPAVNVARPMIQSAPSMNAAPSMNTRPIMGGKRSKKSRGKKAKKSKKTRGRRF